MAHLNNSDGITRHLQRIFMYGDEAQESARVNSFLEYLSTHINPFTHKPYELGARSLYKYIGGEQHFPFDLGKALADWSADEQFMADYDIRPSAEATAKLEVKRDQYLQEMAALQRKIETITGQLDGATQMHLKMKSKRRTAA